MIPASTWYGDLTDVVSLGASLDKAGSLGELPEARRRNLAQFWTPTAVAGLVWRIASEAMDAALQAQPEAKIRLLDNSIGSGRLIQFADPAKHVIEGVDVHGPTVDALSGRLKESGFDFTILHGGMEAINPAYAHYSVALINPPFSLHLESALLQPYPCCAHGRFGPASSALSHAYALYQALDLADVVVAIVPRPFAEEAQTSRVGGRRLRAILDLPAGAFASEGTQVATSLLVFGSTPRSAPPVDLRLSSLDDALPAFGLTCRTARELTTKPLRLRHCKNGTQSITTPVTGDRRVRVYRRGPLLKLSFACGLVHAKVTNALLRARLKPHGDGKHRYPASVLYDGQGQLDIEVHLLQPDPMTSIQKVFNKIREAGGIVDLDPSLLPYLQRRIRRNRIETTPLRHSILIPAGSDLEQDLDAAPGITAIASRDQVVDPQRWGSPFIKKGEAVTLERGEDADGAFYTLCKGKASIALRRAELVERFTLSKTKAARDQWQLRHEGRAARFPAKAEWLRHRARALGLDRWLTWDFQFDDLIEMSMTPGKVIGGHAMGLGKARLAIGLALLGGGRHNLVVVESQLLEEFKAEIVKLGLPAEQWQIINDARDLRSLRRINLVSYTRLRLRVPGRRPKHTFAKALRHRIHTVIADEAHCVSNEDTEQVRALYVISPKRRYGLTGTPAGNYPRSLLPLVVWVAGDGTAAQVYGRRRPYLTPDLVRTMHRAQRGVDAFRDRFVTVEWCTYEWAENMTEGAKREVPSLKNLDAYRAYAGRFVLRRLWEEPEVAKHIRIPKPEIREIELEWDDAHLAYYLGVAEDFAQWWRHTRDSVGPDGKKLNLVAILARLGAVFQAANYPQGLEGPHGAYTAITSKQRHILDYLVANHEEGRKTICFATSPHQLAMFHRQLADKGIDSVLYTGLVPLQKRTRALNERFREGACSTLLASFGVGQAGLNLPQATDEVFVNRNWSPRQELQALYRALRPQQKNALRVAKFQLRGSLDLYMGQMCAMKEDSMKAGLDWGTPEYAASDFEHWLSILDSFCNELAALRQLSRQNLREGLSRAA